MTVRVAVDVGGTFTDVVVVTSDGHMLVGKSPTDHDRMSRGIRGGLAVVADQLGTDSGRLLAEASMLTFATTRATNALLEGRTAKTALLVTQGFPDILVLREGGRPDAFDFRTPFPAPYIPRRLTFQVPERIDAEGGVVRELDVQETVAIIRRLPGLGVEAVAVCFLWSIVNGAHEEEVGRLLERELPGVPYTLAHRLNPIMREYRRASAAAIDASLKPLMQRHLAHLEADLRAAGFAGELLAATSLGGVVHMPEMIERPIYAIRSGPALAPIAGREIAQLETGSGSVIVCDAGGTSFDVSLISAGQARYTRETWVGKRFLGHMTGLSAVDVRSVGAGGGSIAWIDEGGLLRVGPQSAGSDPGPACYGRGGTIPTVTDAAVVLGYIDADYFLGGRLRLDAAAARRALGGLAAAVETSSEHLALAVLRLATQQMVSAVQEVTILEGFDPRESVLVAGGGSIGLNILEVAAELRCERVLLPRIAPALSGCGAHFSDIVVEFTRSCLTNTAEFDEALVNGVLENLDELMDDLEARLRGRGVREFRREFAAEARYTNQVWELEVRLLTSRFRGADNVDAFARAFHRTHRQVYAVSEEARPVECLYWKARLTGLLEKPLRRRSSGEHAGGPEPWGRRVVVLDGARTAEVPVFRGDGLRPGHAILGPALVEEPNTSIVIPPGGRLDVTPFDNFLLTAEDSPR